MIADVMMQCNEGMTRLDEVQFHNHSYGSNAGLLYLYELLLLLKSQFI